MANDIFPVLPGIAWGNSKMPMWNTVPKKTASGLESRAGYMSYPLYQIMLQYEFLRASVSKLEFQQLIGFFNTHGGSLEDFLWKDDSDYTVTDQVFATGDGVTTVFRLGRTLGSMYEPISAVVSPITVKKNDVVQVVGTDYTLSQYTAKVTFTVAPAAGAVLKWSGEYYWRVRFLRDSAEFKQFMKDLWENKRVDLLSVKTV